MDGQRPAQSLESGAGPSSPTREIFSDAIRYWEPRRIPYNLVLTVVVLAWLILTWPHFRQAMTLQHLFFLFVLAALANVCYCAAYLVDVPMQCSLVRTDWRRWRWGLWLMGMLLAIVVANYWIVDEIYPYVS
jgi:hypothetical protein